MNITQETNWLGSQKDYEEKTISEIRVINKLDSSIIQNKLQEAGLHRFEIIETDEFFIVKTFVNEWTIAKQMRL